MSDEGKINQEEMIDSILEAQKMASRLITSESANEHIVVARHLVRVLPFRVRANINTFKIVEADFEEAPSDSILNYLRFTLRQFCLYSKEEWYDWENGPDTEFRKVSLLNLILMAEGITFIKQELSLLKHSSGIVDTRASAGVFHLTYDPYAEKAFRSDSALSRAIEPFVNYLSSFPVMSFWREWYQGFLDGEPMDWELQRRVALIEDVDWDQGAGHIAGVIEEIRARYGLEQRISELQGALVEATKSRHGVGGNNPPEPISNLVPVARELLVVWEPLQELKAELGAPEPNAPKIRTVIEAIAAALLAGIKWCGSKADLAVDTAIKWAIPALSGGYLALNPDKISAVVEAAKAWANSIP